MNITFIGGGSLRVLPIVRSLLDKREFFEGGSIRLVDFQLDRAEAVGHMIMRCPEFKNVNCRVLCTKNLEEGLTGTDILYVTMAIERQPSLLQSNRLARKYNIWTSDNLSPNGAFLAARGAGAIMTFARMMEKVCPNALMLIFANPVAVFSTMVNKHSKIKALGICEGFHNHKWDLPHIIDGEKKHDDNIDVVAAGVNHLSFILRGQWKNRSLKDILDEQLLSDDWMIPKPSDDSKSSRITVDCLKMIRRLYKRFGTMIFSSECDCFAHLFLEESIKIAPYDCYCGMCAEDVIRQAQENMNSRYKQLFDALNSNDDSMWDKSYHENRLFGKNKNDIFNPIFEAIGGGDTFRIVASAPNKGAVQGFPDGASLEYTIDISGKSLKPAPDQYIPHPFQGLIASLSESQTILADAVATNDPRIFADSLECYPMKPLSGSRAEYYKELFTIYEDLPEVYQKAIDFLQY